MGGTYLTRAPEGGTPEPPLPDVPLASTVTDTFVYDGVTYNLSAATRVGYTVTGEPVVEWQPGLQWVSSSEQSFQYSQTTPATFTNVWVSGAEWQTGRGSLYGLGSDNGVGSVGQPLDQRTAVYADVRNIDPGRQAARNPAEPWFTIPGAGTIAKAVYRPNVGSTPRKSLNKYHHIHFVTEWPNVGCFQPNPWSPAPGPVNALFASDITLDGLQSYSGLSLVAVEGQPMPSVASTIATLRQPLWHGWTFSDRMRNLRSSPWPEYGREIARYLSNVCAYLMGNVATTEQKRELAEGLVARALDVAYRIDEGGSYQPGINDNGHQSPWGPLIMVAAALTRNSVRGQIFRDILNDHANKTSEFLPLGQSLCMTREITRNDWLTGNTWGLLDPTSNFRATPRRADETNTYFSAGPRSFMEGSQFGTGTSRGTVIPPRHAMLPYAQNALYAPSGMWWLVSKLGQRSVFPDDAMWPYYDYLIRTMRGFVGTVPWDPNAISYTKTPYGELRSERGAPGDVPQSFVETTGPAGWEIPAQPAPAFVRAFAASNWLNRETRATDNATPFATVVRENWVTLEYNADIAYDPAFMPPASCFTVTVNGSPATIDTAGAVTAGDPRTNGAIRIFRNRIAVAITTRVLPTDTVTIAADWSSAGVNAPRLIDGQLLPSVTPAVTAENRTTPLTAPALHDAVSWGWGTDFPTQAADDPHKRFRPNQNLPYIASEFGINTATSNRITRVLLCFRNLRFPDHANIGQINAFSAIFGSVNNSSTRRRFGLARSGSGTSFVYRGPGGLPTPPQTIFTAAHNGLRIDANVLLVTTDGARQIQIAYSIGGGAWLTSASSVDSVNTDTDANSLQWQSLGDLLGVNVNEQGGMTGFTTTGPQACSARGISWGDCLMHLETSQRPFGTLPALDSAQMTGPLGNRGQNLLPARPDYPSGGAANGIPELYYRATVEQARTGMIPNSGLFETWSLLRANAPVLEEGQIEPFVTYGSGS